MITLELDIDNFYDGERIKTLVEAEVNDPPAGYVPDSEDDEFVEWEWEEIMPHTGTGRTEGNSCYFVTVTKSSSPAVPVGTEYEFGT